VTDEKPYTMAEAARVLGISRSTIYTIAWIRARVFYPSPGCARIERSDVRLYKALMTGRGAERRDEQREKSA
jgi:hypothetical protein